MWSVHCNAFFSELLRHTHQVCGVWVAKAARPTKYGCLVVNVIPGDDVLQARSHGGTDSEDKALFEGPTQQAQHTVPLRAIREVGHTVRSWVSNTRVWVIECLYSRREAVDNADTAIALMARKLQIRIPLHNHCTIGRLVPNQLAIDQSAHGTCFLHLKGLFQA